MVLLRGAFLFSRVNLCRPWRKQAAKYGQWYSRCSTEKRICPGYSLSRAAPVYPSRSTANSLSNPSYFFHLCFPRRFPPERKAVQSLPLLSSSRLKSRIIKNRGEQVDRGPLRARLKIFIRSGAVMIFSRLNVSKRNTRFNYYRAK